MSHRIGRRIEGARRAEARRRGALTLIAFAGLALVAGCGGEEAGAGDAAEAEPTAIGAAMETADRIAERTAQMSQQAEQAAEIDAALAASGQEKFRAKGCIACHTVGGGRLVGPDLKGVTDRRSPGWIVAMIINPDSMLKYDADAKALLAQYYTPMLNQNVSVDEAQAIREYLRRESRSGG